MEKKITSAFIADLQKQVRSRKSKKETQHAVSDFLTFKKWVFDKDTREVVKSFLCELSQQENKELKRKISLFKERYNL